MPDDNHENERRAKAESAFQALLDRLDRSTDTQMALVESLNRISELGEDLMQVLIKVVDSADKYEQILDGVIDHYGRKTADQLGKYTPLLQDIMQIVERVKSLRES